MQHRKALWALLGAAGLLRAVLILRGGQFYWSDEGFFLRSTDMLSLFLQGAWGRGLDFLLITPNHAGYVVLGLPAAALKLAAGSLGWPQAAQDQLAALSLSPFSIAVPALLYAVARRAGAGEDESILAAGFAAASNSLFYYARFLLPYDAALALILGALLAGLAPGRWASWGCGLLAGAGALVYNSYLPLAAAVVLIHASAGQSSPSRALERLGASSAGLAVPWLLLHLLSLLRGTPPYLSWFMGYQSGWRADQGVPAEGGLLFCSYLWSAEGSLLVVWLAAAAAALSALAQGCRSPELSRCASWLAVAGGLSLVLIIASSGLGKIALYGRLVRQVVPFLCLASAASFAWIYRRQRLRPAWSRATAAVLAGLSAFNLSGPLLQRFPKDVRHAALAAHPDLGYGLTIVGPQLDWPGAGGARFVLLNAQHLYPVLGGSAAPAGRELWRREHPLRFTPYLYEGFSPKERRILQENDIAMRLLDTRR